MGGFVLSSDAATPIGQSLRCLWAFDAGTMSGGDGCTAGSCELNTATSGSSWCWWPPSRLESMLRKDAHRPQTPPRP